MKTSLTYLAASFLLIAGLSPTAARGADQLRQFTFGTPTSATRDGFTKVTPKDEPTAEKGVYTLQATLTAPGEAAKTARRQVVVAPDPFAK
ncbi:MAG: hypothetical protein ACYC35_18510 [Pirellulales bacterium]